MEAKPRLLLVNSNRELAGSIQLDLEKHGFQVLLCLSAQEAWQMVEYEQPDIIVSEVMLEEFDSGFTLAKQVKTDQRFRMIPLILMTKEKDKSRYSFDLDKDGYWMKADDYIEKPLEIQDLVERINRLLSGGYSATS